MYTKTIIVLPLAFLVALLVLGMSFTMTSNAKKTLEFKY